jgi:PPOX class probable F420-dependent enzyme
VILPPLVPVRIGDRSGYHHAVSSHDVAARSPTLSPEARDFLARPRIGVIATIRPDGAPHQAVVWYRLDEDQIVINSADGRHWPANLRRDPRIELTVADGYRFVQLAGSVSIDDHQPTAQADIAEMARRYHANEPGEAEALIRDRFSRQHRVSFRFRPTRINVDL